MRGLRRRHAEPSVQKVERLSYFSMFPADYLLDTADLSLSEHGAYQLMMLRYYWEGRLLVIDKHRGCRTEADRASADAIVGRFFHVEGDKLIHNRIERELEKIRAFIQHQSKAGVASGEARKGKKRAETTKINGSKSLLLSGEGEIFYEGYPVKKRKAAALKEWKKLNPNAELMAKIMKALEEQKRSPDWQREGGRYIPHPAKWLAERRWEDEAPPPPVRRVAI